MSRQNKGYKKKKETNINWENLTEEYQLKYIPMIADFIVPFKVKDSVLHQLSMGWDGEAFTFPMRQEYNQIIGIQRRFPDGFKCAVDGSHNGLFIPQIVYYIDKPIFICEGVSDTATVLDLCFQSIGRPNNDSCNEMMESWLLINWTIPSETFPVLQNHLIYIVADNDKVGIRGAEKLAEYLDIPGKQIIIPEEKDIREMVNVQGKEKVIQFLKDKIIP